MDEEIEVAGENEREAETEVSKCQIHVFRHFFLGSISYNFESTSWFKFQARDVGSAATVHEQEVIINCKNIVNKQSKDSPLFVRSGHMVDVEVEIHSCTRSNQVDFHLSSILCTDLKHLQVDIS